MISQYSHNEELQIAERIAYLISGLLLGTLTPGEGEDLDEWIGGSDENLALFQKLTDQDNVEAAMAQFHRIEQNKMPALNALKHRVRTKNKKPF